MTRLQSQLTNSCMRLEAIKAKATDGEYQVGFITNVQISGYSHKFYVLNAGPQVGLPARLDLEILTGTGSVLVPNFTGVDYQNWNRARLSR